MRFPGPLAARDPRCESTPGKAGKSSTDPPVSGPLRYTAARLKSLPGQPRIRTLPA